MRSHLKRKEEGRAPKRASRGGWKRWRVRQSEEVREDGCNR